MGCVARFEPPLTVTSLTVAKVVPLRLIPTPAPRHAYDDVLQTFVPLDRNIDSARHAPVKQMNRAPFRARAHHEGTPSAEADAQSSTDRTRRMRSQLEVGVSLLISLVLAYLLARLVKSSVLSTPEWVLRDWTQIWRGSNALERGENPWLPLNAPGLPYPYRDRNGYPLPAMWLGELFNGVSFGTFSFYWVLFSVTLAGVALARQNLLLGIGLFSWPLMGAAALLQWSPLLLAAARFDLLVAFAACKPNLGLAILAYRPTIRRLAVVGTVAVISLALRPDWLGSWFEAASTLHYVPPVSVWKAGGPLLLLAAFRWKSPEGRLLLALAVLPQNLMSYDQFLLFLVCLRGRETVALVCSGWLAQQVVLSQASPALSVLAQQQTFPEPVVLLLYMPALVIVMLKPASPAFELDSAIQSPRLRF